MPKLERKWWTLIAVCTAIFMLLLDITVVNVALPDIQRSLHSSFSDLQWVVDAYSLTLAAFLLTAGVIGDMFGRREVFAIGLGIFSVSSLVCGLSTSSLMLNLARAVQGVGGAIMFATSLALIAQAFQGKDRGHGLRDLRRGARGGGGRGPAGRRGHHQRHRLAVDLLRQRAHRGRRRRGHPGQGSGIARPQHHNGSTGSGSSPSRRRCSCWCSPWFGATAAGWGSPEIVGLLVGTAVLHGRLHRGRAARSATPCSTSPCSAARP